MLKDRSVRKAPFPSMIDCSSAHSHAKSISPITAALCAFQHPWSEGLKEHCQLRWVKSAAILWQRCNHLSFTDETEKGKFRCLPRISKSLTKVGTEWELWLPFKYTDRN